MPKPRLPQRFTTHVGETTRTGWNLSGRHSVNKRNGILSALTRAKIANGDLPDDWAERQFFSMLAAEQTREDGHSDYQDLYDDLDRHECLRPLEPFITHDRWS